MAGAGQYFNNKLVVDQTELKGSWDFNFRFTPKVPAVLRRPVRNPILTPSRSNWG